MFFQFTIAAFILLGGHCARKWLGMQRSLIDWIAWIGVPIAAKQFHGCKVVNGGPWCRKVSV